MVMKTRLILLTCAMLVSIFSFEAKAQKNEYPGKLPVYGFITADGKKCKEGVVKIYDGNTLISEMATDKKGYFEMGLDMNKYYTLEFETEEMLTKRLSINTVVEKKNAKPVPFECYIDLVPLEKFDGKDISTLDFPVAIVKYNAKKRMFEPSMGYTMSMLQEYNKLTVSED